MAPHERGRGGGRGSNDLADRESRTVRAGTDHGAIEAGLTSLILHMLLVIAMGIWFFAPEDPSLTISLSSEIIGDEGTVDEDLTLDSTLPFEESEVELISDPDDDPFEMSEGALEVSLVDDMLTEAVGKWGEVGDIALPSLLAGRDPARRAQLVREAGGTSASEEAVALGLKWLAAHQHDDGHWSLDAFHQCAGCRGQCRNRGGHSDTAATGLALLPFLGAGQTHRSGDYRQTVDRGLYWLVSHQAPSGDLRGRGIGTMYAHAQATLALCEAYAMTQDESLRGAAQLAVDFIVAAQHRGGGWRYSPKATGDLSVTGWQLMALRSAQLAYLNVPNETITGVARFLKSVEVNKYGSRYRYKYREQETAAMTAEGLLCRQYLGWRKTRRGLTEGCRFLLENHPPDHPDGNMYYWYYATQVMHHMGDPFWYEWNSRFRDRLIGMQSKEGHEKGSWTPDADWSSNRGGRLYMTALAVCTLEVYYRHMPLYQQGAVGDAVALEIDERAGVD